MYKSVSASFFSFFFFVKRLYNYIRVVIAMDFSNIVYHTINRDVILFFGQFQLHTSFIDPITTTTYNYYYFY